jgi:hypothetical protein
MPNTNNENSYYKVKIQGKTKFLGKAKFIDPMGYNS